MRVGRIQGEVGCVSLFLLNCGSFDFPFSVCAFLLPLRVTDVAAAHDPLTVLIEPRACADKMLAIYLLQFVWLEVFHSLCPYHCYQLESFWETSEVL